jgi:amidohydrolase
MLTIEELRAKVCEAIDQRAEQIIGIATHILKNPESGFREEGTARFVQQQMDALGLPHRDSLALTGVRGRFDGAVPGPSVAVIGELDSMVVPAHPYADPVSGAAHACGHHCQIAMMLGVASGLIHSGAAEALAGRVDFFAVPAEELIEVEYRKDLRSRGKLEFIGGKSELVRLGEFDDVNIAMMTHTAIGDGKGKFKMPGTSNGLVVKHIQYLGHGAHAGGSPHKGVNALNAAMLGLQAVHSLRETFRGDDTIRVHPIITRGGDAVSAVPSDVRMETFVRGKTLEAVRRWDGRVDRALRAGAMAVGAGVRITTIPGYLPLENNRELSILFRDRAIDLVGKGDIAAGEHLTGSTDMGDLSHIMPAIHPYTMGASGVGHGADYIIEDYTLAVINPAKVMAMTVIDLLANGAEKAKLIIDNSNPSMTKSAYLATMREFAREEEFRYE